MSPSNDTIRARLDTFSAVSYAPRPSLSYCSRPDTYDYFSYYPFVFSLRSNYSLISSYLFLNQRGYIARPSFVNGLILKEPAFSYLSHNVVLILIHLDLLRRHMCEWGVHVHSTSSR
jgi:hypothetical protein